MFETASSESHLSALALWTALNATLQDDTLELYSSEALLL